MPDGIANRQPEYYVSPYETPVTQAGQSISVTSGIAVDSMPEPDELVISDSLLETLQQAGFPLQPSMNQWTTYSDIPSSGDQTATEQVAYYSYATENLRYDGLPF